jgi:cytochrome P450
MGPLETFGYYLIVFTAGHDTTRNALGGALEAFVEHPEELRKVGADLALTRPAVEEIIRWTTPVNYMKRTALRDAEVRGRPSAKASGWCSSTRRRTVTTTVFDRPFTFDVTRHPNKHLGFGWAEHFCLGAHLARASAHALVREVGRAESIRSNSRARSLQTESSFVVGLEVTAVCATASARQ